LKDIQCSTLQRGFCTCLLVTIYGRKKRQGRGKKWYRPSLGPFLNVDLFRDLGEKEKEQKGGYIIRVSRQTVCLVFSRPRVPSLLRFVRFMLLYQLCVRPLTSKSDPLLGRCWCETVVSAAHAVE
jgi:hypothetical protein